MLVRLPMSLDLSFVDDPLQRFAILCFRQEAVGEVGQEALDLIDRLVAKSIDDIDALSRVSAAEREDVSVKFILDLKNLLALLDSIPAYQAIPRVLALREKMNEDFFDSFIEENGFENIIFHLVYIRRIEVMADLFGDARTTRLSATLKRLRSLMALPAASD